MQTQHHRKNGLFDSSSWWRSSLGKQRRKWTKSTGEVIHLRCEYLVCLEFQSHELNLSCFCRGTPRHLTSTGISELLYSVPAKVNNAHSFVLRLKHAYLTAGLFNAPSRVLRSINCQNGPSGTQQLWPHPFISDWICSEMCQRYIHAQPERSACLMADVCIHLEPCGVSLNTRNSSCHAKKRAFTAKITDLLVTGLIWTGKHAILINYDIKYYY